MNLAKYLKTFIALIVVIGSIGTYYVSAYIDDQSYPDFELHTVEGDETLTEPILISGNYHDYEGSKDAYFQMTNDNFIYRHQQSLLSDMKGVPYAYERRIREDYSSVMRGYGYNGFNLVENDDYVAVSYFEIKDQWVGGQWTWDGTLHVKAENKDAGKKVHIEHEFESNPYGAPRVHDIQLNGDEAVVFIFTWEEKNGEYNEKMDTYTFDLKEKQLKEQHTILSGNADSITIHKLYDTPNWKAHDYVVFRETIEEEEQHVTTESDGMTDEVEVETEAERNEKSTLYAYEVQSAQIKELQLPEQLQTKGASWFDGLNLYFVDENDDHLITVYNIESGDVQNEIVIEGLTDPVITVYDGLVYAIEQIAKPNDPSQLHIYRAESGELVYRGEIAPKDTDKTAEQYTVELYSIHFRY